MINGIFSTLPATRLVRMPVFALLLMLFYVFRRRLYMEHLIIALHSHAFLFLSLLLITLAGMLSIWRRPHAAWVGYLLIMQQRIYRQDWLMTVVKFWLVGWCYLCLLAAALMIAAALGMARRNRFQRATRRVLHSVISLSRRWARVCQFCESALYAFFKLLIKINNFP